jgi:hypothetical protein
MSFPFLNFPHPRTGYSKRVWLARHPPRSRERALAPYGTAFYTTGAFVEPITVWDEPNHLGIRRYGATAANEGTLSIQHPPPHLDGHLQSERGKFRLIPLPDGQTHLVGTSWYRHHMWPANYWKTWSDFLIGRIHLRVLTHIKKLAEGEKSRSKGG